MGDFRTYEYVVGLRAVTSTDGMTADFYQFDMKFLSVVATRIINEVKGVNRVVYDVTSKPPGGSGSGAGSSGSGQGGAMTGCEPLELRPIAAICAL